MCHMIAQIKARRMFLLLQRACLCYSLQGSTEVSEFELEYLVRKFDGNLHETQAEIERTLLKDWLENQDDKITEFGDEKLSATFSNSGISTPKGFQVKDLVYPVARQGLWRA